MSMIKKFFDKKKADAKFALAGKGQKLGETPPTKQEVKPSKASTSQSKGAHGGASKPLSVQQRQAAEAALARVNIAMTQEDFEKKRSQAAIRAQAMKEMENERKAEEEVEKLKSTYGAKKTVELEGTGLLACNGVFYQCPLLGPEVLPKDQMIKRIREFLYEQAREEKGLTATLIIHTLNKDQEKVTLCINTLGKYLENLIQFPSDEKYRKIRKSNKAYQERVSNVEGHDLFLEGAGFTNQVIDGEEFWIFTTDLKESPDTLDNLQTLRDALFSAEPIQAKLDRGLKVLLPSQANTHTELPPDFFTLTAEELAREQRGRTDAVEREMMLRTKAMREMETQRERRKYRFTLIRIRFPDGFVLQGTFSVYEKLQEVFDFVAENLAIPLPFVFVEAGRATKFGESDAESSLVDLGLVPSSILAFAWHPDIAEEVQQNTGGNATYLREDIAALASNNPF